MAHGIRPLVMFVLCAVTALGTTVASANSRVNVQVFRPSPHQGDLINVQGSNIPDDNVWTTSLTLSFGKNPLVFIDTGSQRRDEIVQDQLTLDLMGTYSLFEWVDIGLALPIHLVNTGETDGFSDLREYNSTGLGDIRLSPKIRIIQRGDGDEGFGLAANALFVLPTGDPDGFVSDGFSWQPSVIADFKMSGFHVAANLGARFRESQPLPTENLTFTVVGHEMTYGLGASYKIIGESNAAVTVRGVEFDMMLEMHGGTSDFTANTSHLEGLLAGRVGLPDIGLTATLGGGSGFLPGFGNVKYRLFVGASFAMPHNRDYDEDGIMDDDDSCQEQAEDFDKFEDDDGCPDPDNDGDKIADELDRCPNDAEDFDKFEDGDGCPDLDNDGDAVPDDKDQCPDDPEDHDRFQDEDGCPDADNDGDGMADVADQCPNDVETINGYQDDDGCPDESLAKVEAGRIIILDKVYFATRKAELMPQSFKVLQAVAGILRVTPSIKKIRIEGHTDDRGGKKFNRELSQDRADAVMAFLAQEGVDVGRLEAIGHGKDKPAVEGRTDEAREANRRVEFVIVEQ